MSRQLACWQERRAQHSIGQMRIRDNDVVVPETRNGFQEWESLGGHSHRKYSEYIFQLLNYDYF